VTENGDPFFWLGDTAWELFHRLNREDTEHYLEIRRQQGFNIIQAVALPEFDGLHTPNAYGHRPLLGDDPTRPNEYYFRHLDTVIRMAAAKDLYIGLLPTWGDKVYPGTWGTGPLIFNPDNARVYGHFLGQRYRNDSNLMWILGGDRPVEGYEATWAAMAEGIITGLGRQPFFTYHPPGGSSSSQWLHTADWLDMNMIQSGHVLLDTPNWEMVVADYRRTPVKPTLDGEPNYEHHPIDPFLRQWRPAHGRYLDYDVRKQAYRAVFAGACGHTYGSHSVWQMWTRERQAINFALPTWDEAIYGPGAAQMVHLKNLMLSRPYLTRVPAQEMLPEIAPPPPVADPQADRTNPLRASHPRATRCAQWTYALVYFPLANQSLQVDLRGFAAPVKAWWYDPRNGAAHLASEVPAQPARLTSPLGGPDWVLVLDATAQEFEVPGRLS
jgi:hypothetical protein